MISVKAIEERFKKGGNNISGLAASFENTTPNS